MGKAVASVAAFFLLAICRHIPYALSGQFRPRELIPMRHDHDDKLTPAEQTDELISVANRIANALESLVANSFSLNGPGPNEPPPEPPSPPSGDP